MKTRSILLLALAEIAAMSLWFASAAVLPDMLREADIPPMAQAMLSSAVQAGFVAGALVSAVFGLADRFDPRRLFALCAFGAALLNAMLLLAPIGGGLAILLRFLTGVLLAGIYPPGMKIAVGWGTRDRGFLVGLLVGALTLGSAAPHLASFLGGTDWRAAILATSVAATLGGVMILGCGLGPLHARASAFNPRAITLAWTDRRVRLAIAGYLGHMWELYAMWAWVGTAVGVSYAMHLAEADAARLAKLTAFLAIGLGGVVSIGAGVMADRIGKAEVAIIAMIVSGAAALLTAATFGGPVWITFLVVMIWGASVIPDSAQFSALVADAAPPELAGSLMTLQTSLGFTLTFFTVQATPVLVTVLGWPLVMAMMALGPAYGIWAMQRLRGLAKAALEEA